MGTSIANAETGHIGGLEKPPGSLIFETDQVVMALIARCAGRLNQTAFGQIVQINEPENWRFNEPGGVESPRVITDRTAGVDGAGHWEYGNPTPVAGVAEYFTPETPEMHVVIANMEQSNDFQ